MKTIILLAALFSSFSANAFIESGCERKLTEFTISFLQKNSLEMFKTEKENLTIDFLSFANTTPGSFYQGYEVKVQVSWPSEVTNFPFKRDLALKFHSPFICDRLEVRQIILLNE